MLTESELFVWEVFGDTDAGRLSPDIREQLQACLRKAEAPLRWVVLVSSLFAYALPLVFFQDSLLEALAGQDVERAWLAIAVLFGVSTLVLSPLFGVLAQSRRESRALLLDGRKFTPQSVLRTSGATGPLSSGAVQLSIGTVDGARDVVIADAFGSVLPADCVVYALPEEANVAVVQWTNARGSQMARGYLQASGPQGWA